MEEYCFLFIGGAYYVFYNIIYCAGMETDVWLHDVNTLIL